MTNLELVINILSDGDFHDGDSIGQQLNITRAGVWKIIKKLLAYGVKIDSIKGKGYALAEPLALLNKEQIFKHLINKNIRLDLFETIPSTNDYLKTLGDDKMMKLAISECQTSGKGRLQRSWHSPFAQNLYLSLYYPFQKDLSQLTGLSLVTGLAICQTINEIYNLPNKAQVKWPNDVLHENKKLSGTLIEIQAEANGFCSAIIGIGINVNMQSDQDRIDQDWTSIRKITGQYIDRNILCAKLIDNLVRFIEEFSNTKLAAFTELWQQNDALLGKQVWLENDSEPLKAEIIGINDLGHLRVKLDSNEIKDYCAGDVRIIKDSRS